MTLQQLKYVITIADCGSMNEAAKQLYLSQPSLSETVMILDLQNFVFQPRRTLADISFCVPVKLRLRKSPNDFPQLKEGDHLK